MGSSIEDTRMSSDLVTSTSVERWRSRIQKSSSLIIQGPLDVGEWLGLVHVLEHDDVSGIEFLKLSIPRSERTLRGNFPEHIWEEVYFPAVDSYSYPGRSRVEGFGNALRKARFSGLKSLEIEEFD
ncbi:unnamed protein product [Calypogeia fissa]